MTPLSLYKINASDGDHQQYPTSPRGKERLLYCLLMGNTVYGQIRRRMEKNGKEKASLPFIHIGYENAHTGAVNTMHQIPVKNAEKDA